MYIEPSVILVARGIVSATRSWMVALVMLIYAVVVVLNLLGGCAFELLESHDTSAVMKSVEHASHIREIAHVYVWEAGWANLSATWVYRFR
ncbi:hypothetical protein QF002_001872 [Paraburkholderia youngii]